MDTFTDKIQGLQAEISSIDNRITASHVLIDRLGPEVAELETAFKEAKKVVALDPSGDNRRTVETLRKKLDKAESDLDEAAILAEALTDRKEQLENELAAAKLSLSSDECVRLAAKAPGLAEQYDKSIRAAFDAALRLKLLRQMLASRNGTLNVGDTYGVFDQVYAGFPLIGSYGGDTCKLRESTVIDADIKVIMAELLTV